MNQAKWLQLCLASVADQTVSESRIPNPESFSVEHLVQDGGSRDGTPSLLQSWKDKLEKPEFSHPNFRFDYFSDPDRGMYDAINRGLTQASGDIAAWLNCDEQYLPGAFSLVAAHFAEHPETDVLFGDFIMADAGCRPLCYRRTVIPTAWHTRLCHLNTATCAMFFRRTLFTEGHRFDPQWKMIGDAEWIWRLCRAGKRFTTLNHPLGLHVHTERNQSGTRTFLKEQEKWRESAGVLAQTAAPLAAGAYVVRKWAAGAYQTRDLELALYKPTSPGIRSAPQHFHLGWRWPRQWMQMETP